MQKLLRRYEWWSAFLGLLFFTVCPVQSQNFEVAKFGGDLLSVGGGARPLGMGSAYTAVTRDVSSGYWNVAGLAAVEDLEVIYMHSERFNGLVSYDYGAFAIPVRSSDGVFAVSFFRQGVDDIKNTLNAWDPDRQRPRTDPERFISEFSTYEMAFLLSYAAHYNENLRWGATAKILNSHLGPFADAWGYSLDVGLQYDTDFATMGLNLMDITTLMKFWNVNADALEPLAESYDDEIPEGQNELVLPTLKAGISKQFPFDDFTLTAATDVDLRFEGRRSHYLNAGDISFHPHIGGELSYREIISLRAGITHFTQGFDGGLSMSPTLGAGLQFNTFRLDYGFSSFAGTSSDFGFTHRISLQVTI